MAFLHSILATSLLLLALLVIASATDYGYVPAPKVENPKSETDYTPHPTKPDYEVPKPKGEDELQLLPTLIGVQGVVLCKSGSNYIPIQGIFFTDLESSPLETCKIPTDVNYGISGARLSSYRLLHNNMKLYSVGPFFCTSQPKPLPNGY